jgi:hypothetical protein
LRFANLPFSLGEDLKKVDFLKESRFLSPYCGVRTCRASQALMRCTVIRGEARARWSPSE